MVAQTPETGIATWTIDPSHTLVEFSIKHMVFTTAKGKFTVAAGDVTWNEQNVADSSVKVTFDVASIATGDEKRDTHLRSADFFDAANHPQASFVSTKVVPQGGDGFLVQGDLTIRGIVKPVVLDATYNGRGKSPWGTEVAAFTAETKLNREDWGLTWNVGLETGGFVVGKDVKILIETELIKQ